MGKRERKKWTFLDGQRASLAVLGGLFLLGGVAGGMFAGLADGDGARALGEYLGGYLASAAGGTVQRGLLPVLWEQLRYLLAALILGVTALGVVGLPLLFVIRGFFFSFSVGCCFRVFGAVGLLPALVLFGIPALVWAPGFFLAGVQGLSNARCLLRRGLGDGRPELPAGQSAYWVRAGFCCVLFVICGGLEYLVVPVLLRAAARVVLSL